MSGALPGVDDVVTIEPLHPTHDIDSFDCAADPYFNHALKEFWDYAPYVVGQRVLVSAIGGRVTGYLSMIDSEVTIPDEDEPWDCLFVGHLAVSGERLNSRDAVELVNYALKCIDPAERASGREYRAVLIQPASNPALAAAAARMHFKEMPNGQWWRQLRKDRS